MRTKHEEVLPPIRKTGRITEVADAGHNAQDDQPHELNGVQLTPLQAPSSARPEVDDLLDDPEIVAMVEGNPHLPADEVRYACLQTKYDFLESERKALLAELESVENLRLAVEGCKDRDLTAVLQVEIGDNLDDLLMEEKMAPLVWKYANRTSLPNVVRAADPISQANEQDDDD
jgi:hypothetical protein